MQIKSLSIKNFKAIKSLFVEELGSVVIIAGPNGCGKSCIFDAIRLLKSYYGGYRSANEWQNFYSEHNIDLKSPLDLARIFHDINDTLEIQATFIVSDSEQAYIKEHCEQDLYRKLWRQHIGQYEDITMNIEGLPKEQQDRYNAVREEAKKGAVNIINELDKSIHTAAIGITSTHEVRYEPSFILQYIFSTFDPPNIGIIDYHGPNRNYARENAGGLQIRVQDSSDKFAQHALYNYAGKYSNIKSEMASALVRDLLIREAGDEYDAKPSVIRTLQELFEIFIPGKTFLGPKPTKDGKIAFPVILSNSNKHDIDDLSSGEKELVYGYLRLRNESPANSIILLDEPELHLNPRLVQGLPDFYRRHLGQNLHNQLWMVTHSDAFLRDAFKSGGFSLFHMTPPEKIQREGNQASIISAKDEIQRTVIDLVGDLAAYRPGSKLVIFESSESARFDAEMTMLLFPELRERITAIPGESKQRVEKLFSVLSGVIGALDSPFELYAIVDRDSRFDKRRELGGNFLVWDRYHIENYLLESKYIQMAIDGFPIKFRSMYVEEIEAALKECARESADSLIRHEVQFFVDRTLKETLDLGYDSQKLRPSDGLRSAVERVGDRISRRIIKELSLDNLLKIEEACSDRFDQSLETDEWKKVFRGRDILSRFAGKFTVGLSYELFRDSILDKMRNDGFRPVGMGIVLKKITEA